MYRGGSTSRYTPPSTSLNLLYRACSCPCCCCIACDCDGEVAILGQIACMYPWSQGAATPFQVPCWAYLSSSLHISLVVNVSRMILPSERAPSKPMHCHSSYRRLGEALPRLTARVRPGFQGGKVIRFSQAFCVGVYIFSFLSPFFSPPFIFGCRVACLMECCPFTNHQLCTLINTLKKNPEVEHSSASVSGCFAV